MSGINEIANAPAPMELGHEWPMRVSEQARNVVLAWLNRGCRVCHGAAAELTYRPIGGSHAVYLQCVTCGSSIGNALKKADHPRWREYIPWDGQRNADWWQAERRKCNAEWEDGRAARQAGYSEFLLTGEWRSLRARVMSRAGHRCEACLARPATEVHHTTYRYGWLPPGWCLFAVCWPCHERFHSEDDDWRAVDA